jgi:gallate decarboxylase subunit D
MSGTCSLTDFCGRIMVTLTSVQMGEDLLVALHGGDRPHIGAVAISQPRFDVEGEPVTGACTSVITVYGHREDQLARDVAHRIARELGVTVTVACGIHIDKISPREIKQVLILSETLTSRFIEWQQKMVAQHNNPLATGD